MSPMPRIEIELTSSSDDGTWTWRAAGARLPRGAIDGTLLPSGTAVGDLLRVETDQDVDGIQITAVLPSKSARNGPEVLEMLGRGGNEPLVTTRLAGKGRGSRRGDDRPRRGDDRPRRARGRDGDGRDRPQDAGSDGGTRRPRRGADESAGSREGRKPRKRSEKHDQAHRRGAKDRTRTEPAQPRAKRLRPKRRHRKAALEALPEDQRLIGEHLVRSGLPGLRGAIAAQNTIAAGVGEPEIPADLLLNLAERIQPRLRTAEWHDRAEAALAGIGDVDLRDLRSVVVAAETAARTDETRALAEKIREGLTTRVDREHGQWLHEVTSTLKDGRIVRALRLSSRPPKAGAPLPTPVLEQLAAAASASLTSEISQDRWATVLDAVALSPVHQRVVPEGLPTEPGDALLEVVRRVSMNVPDIAAAFGVEPKAPRRSRRPSRPASS